MMKSNTSQKSYIGFAFQKVSNHGFKSIRNEHVVQKFSMVVTRSETKETNQKGMKNLTQQKTLRHILNYVQSSHAVRKKKTYNRYTVCVGKHGLESVIHADVVQNAKYHYTVNLIG